MPTKHRTASKKVLFDSPEQEAYLQLWRTYDRLREIEERTFREHGISAQQYNTLRLLKAAHPARLATHELSQRLISRAPDMTRLLDKLESLQLIERQRCPTNRRVIEVAITRSGVAKLKTMAAQVRQCSREQLGHLKQDQLRSLIALLRQARAPHETASEP